MVNSIDAAANPVTMIDAGGNEARIDAGRNLPSMAETAHLLAFMNRLSEKYTLTHSQHQQDPIDLHPSDPAILHYPEDGDPSDAVWNLEAPDRGDCGNNRLESLWGHDVGNWAGF